MSDPIRGRWTITSAHTERDTSDPDCPNYRVGATVKGPEQREPIEVVPVPDEQAIERAAEDLEAEVKSRNEWYGLDNWTFREVVEFVAGSLHPQLPKAQHGQEDTNARAEPTQQREAHLPRARGHEYAAR